MASAAWTRRDLGRLTRGESAGGRAALMSRGSRHLAMLTSLVTLVYGAGLELASLWQLTAGKPVNATYAVAFGVLAIGSLAVYLIERREEPAVGRDPTRNRPSAA